MSVLRTCSQTFLGTTVRCASPMLRRQSPNNLRRACLPVPLSRAHERLACPCDASPMTPETYSSPSCPALVCHAHAFDAYSETFHTIRDVLSRSRSHYTAAGPAGSCSSHALGRRRPRVGAEHYARGHSECGIIDGVHLYPVTHIVTGLQQRFAMLGDEHRLAAMTQLLAFSRRQGETINGGLARYEVVCRRAAREGHFVMSWAGCALQLLRARNMSSQQMIQFLQPFQGRLPQGEAAFHSVQCSYAPHWAHLGARSKQSWSAITREPTGTAWEYHADIPRGYLQTTDKTPAGGTFLWADAPASGPGWGSWSPDITTGGSDGWGDSVDQSVFPGFRQDNGESSDPTSSATSSDSGTEFIDMTDLQPVTYEQASEHVFWQYRTHRRRWTRLTAKPARRFRRHVRYFVKRRGKGRRFRSGFGFGGHRGRRSYVVTQDDIRAYLGDRGKGSGLGNGKRHGRLRNPRGRDGQVMTFRICNSEAYFGAKCPHGQGGGRGSGSSGMPSATFRVPGAAGVDLERSWKDHWQHSSAILVPCQMTRLTWSPRARARSCHQILGRGAG